MTDAHPALTQASQIALTLRAVGGLTTAEIASAFLVPETTVGQRISRAKALISDQGATFRMPDRASCRSGCAVHRVLYLIFNEGTWPPSGEQVLRTDPSVEAIRLARLLHTATPADGDCAALLALMLLTDARRAARLGPGGIPIPLLNPAVAVAVAMVHGPHAGLAALDTLTAHAHRLYRLTSVSTPKLAVPQGFPTDDEPTDGAAL